MTKKINALADEAEARVAEMHAKQMAIADAAIEALTQWGRLQKNQADFYEAETKKYARRPRRGSKK